MIIKKGLVSIIIPVYNVENYLNKCLDSILNQTYQNLEVILVDDGSPDGCPAICDAYAKKDKRVKVIHKANGGVSNARNDGMNIATGEFVAFIDSDDWIESTMFENLVNKQMVNAADLVFCRMNWVFGDKLYNCFESNLEQFCNTKNINLLAYDSNNKTYKNKIICHNIFGAVWRVLFKREIISDLKFEENCSMAEDLIFLLQSINRTNVVLDFVNDYLYNYVIREGSLCRNNDEIITKVNNTIKNTNILIDNLTKLTNNDKSELIGRYAYNAYCACYLNLLYEKDNEILKDIQHWKTKFNYKSCKKYTKNYKTRIINFMIYHNMKHTLKLLKSIKKNK